MHTEVRTSLRNDLTFKQVFSEKKFLIDFLNAFFKFVEVNNYVVDVEESNINKPKGGKLSLQ